MLLRCVVLLLYLNVARTSEVNTGLSSLVSDVDARYSLWPSIHDGVRLMRRRKREAEALPPTTKKPGMQPVAQANAEPLVQEGQSGVKSGVQASVQSEPQPVGKPPQSPGQPALSPDHPPEQPPHEQQQPASPSATTQVPAAPNNVKEDYKEGGKVLDNNTVRKLQDGTASDNSTNAVDDKLKVHNTTATESPKINLSDPGVVKRAFIVFGGFALLATAYYFFIYRKKSNTNDAKNTHSSIDPNQFRYGVLESEDKRSNMELSRVPLTMESDEDEDEDLEIFDLGQKKKSLSYINLEQHDEDIVLNDSRSIDMENLLVDIEDKNSDTLINWSSSGSKSIL